MPLLLVGLAVAVLQTSPSRAADPPQVVGGDPLRPDTVLVVPGGPRVILVNSVGGGVAALRLSVPLIEGPAEAGAGVILRDLALQRMRGLAGPVGAHISASRTPWGLAYAVEGAAADLEYLAYLLREAVAEPEGDPLALGQSRQRLAAKIARESETPSGRLIAELRRAAAPGLPPLYGTAGTVAGLDVARIREVWRRSHRPEAMTLVVAAAVVPEVVLASVKGMGAVGSPVGPPLDAPAPPEPSPARAHPLRTWYGEAFDAGLPSDPHAAVAVRLISDILRERSHGFEAGVQLLALRDRWLLVVAGAAYGRDERAMRTVISGVLAETRSALTPQAVGAVVERLRRDILFEARTPAGLVERIGQASDITGAASAASVYMAALERVDLQSLSAFWDAMISTGPTTAEVRP